MADLGRRSSARQHPDALWRAGRGPVGRRQRCRRLGRCARAQGPCFSRRKQSAGNEHPHSSAPRPEEADSHGPTGQRFAWSDKCPSPAPMTRAASLVTAAGDASGNGQRPGGPEQLHLAPAGIRPGTFRTAPVRTPPIEIRTHTRFREGAAACERATALARLRSCFQNSFRFSLPFASGPSCP